MSSKVRRYCNVSLPQGPVMHRMYPTAGVRGNKTACGLSVSAGWYVWMWPEPVPKLDGVSWRRCKRCGH